MEFVPVQSYYKATLAQLFDNEGEVKWDSERLRIEIDSRIELVSKLKETGYQKTSKSFTAQQIELIFKYISRPILNDKNMHLLKIKPKTFDLLEYHKNLNTTYDMPLDEIKDGVLLDFGVYRNLDFGSAQSPNKSNCYLFKHNANICLKRTLIGFDFYDTETLEMIKSVNNTKDFILELLKLRNL